jgi:Rieske Fe-S protein
MSEQYPTEHAAKPNISRRGFLLGLLGGAGAMLASVLGYAGNLWFRPADAAPPDWQAVGAPEDFHVGETLPVLLEQPGGTHLVWLRRTAPEELIAFSSSCTHLGATVNWFPQRQLFECSVHGGRFRADGALEAGPPPRPLDRHAVRMIEGQVVIERRPERSARVGCAGCGRVAGAGCAAG